MNKFTLNIYKGKQKVRTLYADQTKLTMGIVRKLSNLIGFETEKNVLEMTRQIDLSWSDIEELFSLIFTDISPEEWDGVRMKDIIGLIKQVMEISISKALMIPSSKQEEFDPFMELKTPTFGESLFKIEYNLCRVFCYTPDRLDKMAYTEVIEIYSNMRRIQIEDKRIADRKKELDEKGIKYVPATGNDW